MQELSRRQSVVLISTWWFCFLYTLLYLPENYEKRAHWVLSPQVFHAPHDLPWTLRLFLAVVVASSVSIVVILGSFLHRCTEQATENHKNKEKLQETSITALLKEYSLLIAAGSILYCSIYIWCVYSFQQRDSLAYRIASNFFVDGAGKDFAWISAGFYTSVLALSFFHPFENKRNYYFSNRVALMIAAIGGFGGMAGVGGVCLIIAADLVDIATSIVSSLLYNYETMEYLAFVVTSLAGSYSFFFGFGGLLHYIYYKQQKANAENWKCQPLRWLSYNDHRHEILLGTFNITIASLIAGTLSFKIYKDQWTQIYFQVSEYGYLYLLGSIVLLFMYTEAIAYYIHRTFHKRLLYRTFHKWHHRYKAPTAFAALAIHPVEYACYQACLLLPVFIVPLHFAVYGAILTYLYYFGMVDHSGIKFTSWFPWQPSSMYHDDHHKFFHCNFGQNTLLFDLLHGTLRKANGKYGESRFVKENKEALNYNWKENVAY